jgi:glycine hydroxymethyltransferase
MARIAGLLAGVVRGESDAVRTRAEVRELAGAFPPYPG